MNVDNRDSSFRCNKSGSWIGIGTAFGVVVFAATNEPVWIAVGVAIGAALGWKKPKTSYKKEKVCKQWGPVFIIDKVCPLNNIRTIID